MRTLILSTAVATLAAIGAASAQPVTLSDNQLDQATAGAAGGFTAFQLAVQKIVAVQVQKEFSIRNLTESLPVLQGNFNDSEASATALGKASFTQTTTLGEAVQNRYSRGFSESVAAANRPAR